MKEKGSEGVRWIPPPVRLAPTEGSRGAPNAGEQDAFFPCNLHCPSLSLSLAAVDLAACDTAMSSRGGEPIPDEPSPTCVCLEEARGGFSRTPRLAILAASPRPARRSSPPNGWNPPFSQDCKQRHTHAKPHVVLTASPTHQPTQLHHQQKPREVLLTFRGPR